MKGVESIQKRIDAHCKLLQEGITKRERRLQRTHNNSEKLALKEQLTNWRKELEEFKTKGLSNHLNLVSKPLVSNTDCKRVEIIVLKYKIPEVEKRCMDSLIEFTEWPHQVRWYDNRNQTANFSKIWNRLTEESTCDYVLIMDSDAFVCQHGWLTRMMSSFEPGFKALINHKISYERPVKTGLVVPITREGGAHTLQGDFEYSPEAKPFITDAQVSGFFFLFKKQMWEELGGFDERFYLHGQDSEWVDRVIASDWQIVVRRDVYVEHLVSASINKSRKEREINYEVDLQYTKLVYDLIREEKELGKFKPQC